MRFASVFFLAMAAAAGGAAHAQTQYYSTVEGAARIGDEHTTRFDRDSVVRMGEMLRFDVTVQWKQPDARPESEAPYRIVRFVVRCEEKEIAVGAVAVFDNSRILVKSFGVPPGGWDFAKAEKQSRERNWLEQACDMPV